MDWSEQTLKQIYEAEHQRNWALKHQHTVGNCWPYNGGSDEDIEAHLYDVVADLETSSLISVEADFNSYGSGYASFVDVFCFKKDGSSRKRFLGSGEKTTGIQVYISRLAAVAAYGAEERTRHPHGGSSSLLSYDSAGTTPPGNWQAVLQEIAAKLQSNRIEIADGATLNRLLPFQVDIETNLGEPPYRVFDLLFYWFD